VEISLLILRCSKNNTNAEVAEPAYRLGKQTIGRQVGRRARLKIWSGLFDMNFGL